MTVRPERLCMNKLSKYVHLNFYYFFEENVHLSFNKALYSQPF